MNWQPTAREPGELCVRDVMVTAPITVGPADTVLHAVRQMNARRIGAVLVLDARKLVGIFTERDFLRQAVEAEPGWRALPVADWMSTDLVTIGPDDGWEEAMLRMEQLRIRHLPVLEGDDVLGIVSSRQLIGRRTEHLNRRVEERTADLQTLAARLLDKERDTQLALTAAGRLLNRLLLPHSPPDVPTLTWGVAFEPLDMVGGDYYDFARPDARHIGILIADASGHSVPAAMVAVMARIAFAEVRDTTTDPAVVLAAMNRRLLGLTDERFVTAFYGVLNTEAMRFTYATAGHPYPLHFSRADGAIRPLEARGFVLGFLPDAQYQTATLELRPGDQLLFFTDGVTDSRSPAGDVLGRSGLHKMFAANAERPAKQLAPALVRALDQFRGSRPASDDCTLVTASVRNHESLS